MMCMYGEIIHTSTYRYFSEHMPKEKQDVKMLSLWGIYRVNFSLSVCMLFLYMDGRRKKISTYIFNVVRDGCLVL